MRHAILAPHLPSRGCLRMCTPTLTRSLRPASPQQEVEERDKLVQLVNAQAAEIQNIKAQISALHRKDTSMYQ